LRHIGWQGASGHPSQLPPPEVALICAMARAFPTQMGPRQPRCAASLWVPPTCINPLTPLPPPPPRPATSNLNSLANPRPTLSPLPLTPSWKLVGEEQSWNHHHARVCLASCNGSGTGRMEQRTQTRQPLCSLRERGRNGFSSSTPHWGHPSPPCWFFVVNNKYVVYLQINQNYP
jgi:hypothetical protein